MKSPFVRRWRYDELLARYDSLLARRAEILIQSDKYKAALERLRDDIDKVAPKMYVACKTTA